MDEGDRVSGHKFGLSPLGVGWVIWREKEDLPEDLVFHVNYLGGDMLDFAFNFSRPGGSIVAQCYNFRRLGKEGYRKIHTACYETAEFLAREIASVRFSLSDMVTGADLDDRLERLTDAVEGLTQRLDDVAVPAADTT